MMPIHRRHNASGTEIREENTSLNTNKGLNPKSSHDGKSAARIAKIPGLQYSDSAKKLLILGLVSTQLFLLALVAFKTRIQSASQLAALLFTVWVVSLPLVLISGLGLGVFDQGPSDMPHQRYIPLAVVGTIVGNQLPVFVSSALAAAAIWIFGLCSRPIQESASEKTKNDAGKKEGLSGPVKTVLAVVCMTASLLTENFFIWVVSATYKDSQNMKTLPKPLQDNGQLVLRYLLNEFLGFVKRDVVKVRNMISVEWILVSGLGMSLVAVEMHGKAMKRNLWSIALRAVLTLAIARAIRTFSFMITVLPSQNPKCYFSHFPAPPPEDWHTWLMTGFIPQANGGCNDLIISGHATVTSTLASVVTSVVGKPLFTSSIWMFIAIDYMVEIYEGFHYSVDMWLGAILVNFIWNTLAPIENSAAQEVGSAPARSFHPFSEATRHDWFIYAIPAFVAYIQMIGILIPKDMGNYTILAFVVAVIYQLATTGFQQYTQHTLFCLLFMALGIYL